MTGQRVSRLRLLAVVLLGLPVFCQGTAQGADPTKRFSLAGQAGASRLAMGDVNRAIKDGNKYLKSQDWTTLGALHLGFNFSYDLRVRVTGPLSLSVGGAHTSGSSSVDFKQVISVKPSVDAYHLRVLYLLPYRPRPTVLLSVGAGPVYIPKAKLSVTHEVRQDDNLGFDRVVTATFEGKGSGAHAFLQAETILSEKITLVADLGYRWAAIKRDAKKDTWKITGISDPRIDADHDHIPNEYDLNPGSDTDPNLPSYITESFLTVPLAADGRPTLDANGRPTVVPKGRMDLDFSGVVLNVGLRFYLF